LPRCIEGNLDMSISCCFDRGVIDRFCEQAGAGMEPCIVVPDQDCGAGIKGALRRDGGNGGLICGGVRPLQLHLAVMRTVAAAADGQVRIGVCREREQRRHQRKAEEQQQRKCQDASHIAIVADEECREGCAAGGVEIYCIS